MAGDGSRDDPSDDWDDTADESVDDSGEVSVDDTGGESVDDTATDTGWDDEATGPDGKEKGPNEKFCRECGAVINQRAEICPECGVRQPGYESEGGDERIVAALLAILLGDFGAHKFYLGQTTQGILYLCFFWTLIPGIIGIIEGVIYLTKSDDEFRRQYVE